MQKKKHSKSYTLGPAQTRDKKQETRNKTV